MIRSINKGRRFLLIALVAAQVCIAALAVLSFPTDERDFLIQVTAGRVSDLDGNGVLYDPGIQLRRQNEIPQKALGEDYLLPFNHPPLLLPFLRPLSRMSYRQAFTIWTIVSSILLILAASICTAEMRSVPGSSIERKVVPLAFLAFFPMAIILAQGQDTALLMLGLAGWLVLLDDGRDVAAGFALSLASIRPHIALGLSIPFLFARREVFAGFVAGALILTFYSIAMVGLDGAFGLVQMVRATGTGEGLVIGQSHMPNLQGFLTRHTVLDVHRAVSTGVSWSAWALFVALSVFWWLRSGSKVSVRDCGLLLLGTVLFVPHIHLHDVAIWAFPPVLSATKRLSADRADWDLPVVSLAGASLFLTLMAISPELLFDLWLASAVLLIAIPLIRDIEKGNTRDWGGYGTS